jgi:hypothetical protein
MGDRRGCLWTNVGGVRHARLFSIDADQVRKSKADRLGIRIRSRRSTLDSAQLSFSAAQARAAIECSRIACFPILGQLISIVGILASMYPTGRKHAPQPPHRLSLAPRPGFANHMAGDNKHEFWLAT